MTLVALLLVMLFPLSDAGAASPPTAANPMATLPAPGDAALTRALPPGEVHRYCTAVDAPSLLVTEVKQRGVDVALTLSGARRGPLLTAAGEGGPWSDEILAGILPRKGIYCLLVSPDADETHGGRYLLKTVELRPARPADGERIAVEQALHVALQEREIPDGGEKARRRSIAMLRRVAGAFADIGAAGRQADALHELGSTLLEVGEQEPAVAAFREERSLRKRLDDEAGEAWSLEGLARALSLRGDFAEALASLRQARRLAQSAGDRSLLASVDNTLGYVYLRQQKYSQAIGPIQRAVSGHRATGNRREEAIALMNLGGALRTTGDDTKRCSAIERGTHLLVELRYPSPLAFAYLGQCRQAQGRIDGAFKAYERGIEQARAEEDPLSLGVTLLYSGSLLAQLGEYDKAERRILAARRALDDRGLLDFRVHAELHLGWLALAQGEPSTALTRFEEARDMLRDDGDGSFQRSLASVHRAIGSALIQLGRPGDALADLERAEALSRDAPERRPAEALRKLGVAHMELGDLEAAEESLAKSLAMVGEDAAQAGATHSQLARLAVRQGKLEEALSRVETAIRIRESVRANVAPPSLRASYLARWRDDYGLAIDLLVRLAGRSEDGRAKELVRRALTMSERAHSRTLQELLVEARSRKRMEVPQELARLQRDTEQRLSRLSSALTGGTLSDEDEAAVRRRLEATADELTDIEWQIRERITRPDPAPDFDLPDLQAELRPDEALLEYFLGADRCHLFVVTHDGLHVFDVGASEEIRRLVGLAREGLASERRHQWRRLIQVSRKLYDHLVAPAEGVLTEVKRLIVVPDRELFYLPMESLLRESPPRTAIAADLAPLYLLAHWQVGYVPSATVLSQLRPGAAAPTAERKTLVAFADPAAPRPGSGNAPLPGARPTGDSEPARSARRDLPGAREEVAAIAGLMKGNDVRVYVGEQATEERLTDHRHAARWYHFAVHGILDEEHPALSGLVLADGELQVYEIYDLDLQAELVVLSACETGLGRMISGEELIGLSRAFFYAGVPTAVVSLWRVADRSTAPLMVRFYELLLAGNDPVSALSEAKRWLLESSEWQHPYHWAPFVVLGHPHPTPRNVPPSTTPK